MSDPTNKPVTPPAKPTQHLEALADDDERPAPTRPPRMADFIRDRDKTDPLRRFRF